MKDEYTREELGKGRRGTHYKAYLQSHNIVRLDPEIAKAFPTEKAVNDALARLLELAKVVSDHKKGQLI